MELQHHNQKYALDFNFFNQIDTEEKAYIFGFLYADGCLYRTSIIFNICSIDIDILEKIRNVMQFTGQIYINPPRDCKLKNEKVIHIKEQSRLQITNKFLIEQLKKLGLTERKSKTLVFPQTVPKHLLRHFIRGYFDGDGSVSIDRNCLRLNCSFVGTHEFLSEIKNILMKNSIDSGKIYKHNGMSYLRVGKYWNIKKFYTFLYHDSKIFLSRKNNIFNNYFNVLPEKRKTGTSKYKGVYYNKYDKNWTVRFRSKRIGSSKDENTAHEIFKNYENKWIFDGMVL
jgi:LAGLIDADG-like domain